MCAASPHRTLLVCLLLAFPREHAESGVRCAFDFRSVVKKGRISSGYRPRFKVNLSHCARFVCTLHPGHRGSPDAPLRRPHATPSLPTLSPALPISIRPPSPPLTPPLLGSQSPASVYLFRLGLPPPAIVMDATSLPLSRHRQNQLFILLERGFVMRQLPGGPVFAICLSACASLLISTVDSDEDVQTHDGPVDKAELATVLTTTSFNWFQGRVCCSGTNGPSAPVQGHLYHLFPFARAYPRLSDRH